MRLAAVAVAVAVTVLALGFGAGSARAGVDDSTPTPTTVNEFVPEDRDLSDCISSLPKPGCGSEARGGWRQGVVLALVLTGMALIGLRVALAIRRRDRELTPRTDP